MRTIEVTPAVAAVLQAGVEAMYDDDTREGFGLTPEDVDAVEALVREVTA